MYVYWFYLLQLKGYKLEIKIFEDYTTPNLALEDGSIDVNYFQHLPYLNSFNEANNTSLVSVAKIHYEPLGLYGKDVTKVEDAGKTIIIPNDDSNGSRALILLAERFATMAVTLFFWIPIDIISFINWNKHKDKENKSKNAHDKSSPENFFSKKNLELTAG